MRQTCEHEDTDFRKKLINMTEVKRTLPNHLYQIYSVHDHHKNDKKIKVKNLNTEKGKRGVGEGTLIKATQANLTGILKLT